jgi:hypothetical protein
VLLIAAAFVNTHVKADVTHPSSTRGAGLGGFLGGRFDAVFETVLRASPVASMLAR